MLHRVLHRGGPAGPEVIEPLALLVRDHADPAGQQAVMRNTIVEGGPAGPEVIEPLELLVLDHVDPAGQHPVIRDTTRLLEHPLTRPESSLSDGLVERISDGEPAAHQVPDTTLDSRPMEGITYLEHLVPSCLEPLEQSILHSLWIAQPKECVIEEGSVWKPVLNPVLSYTLDSRFMEGNTYREGSALGVSLDSGPTHGASCLELLEQSVQDITPDGRPMEGTAYPEHLARGASLESGLRAGMSSSELLQQSVRYTSLVARPQIENRTSDCKPVINPVQDNPPDGQPMEGTTYPEHPALGVSLDSGLRAGMSSIEPTRQLVLNTLSVIRYG